MTFREKALLRLVAIVDRFLDYVMGGGGEGQHHLCVDVGDDATDGPRGVERKVHVLDLLEDGQLRPLLRHDVHRPCFRRHQDSTS